MNETSSPKAEQGPGQSKFEERHREVVAAARETYAVANFAVPDLETWYVKVAVLRAALDILGAALARLDEEASR